RCITILGFPNATYPGVFDALNDLNFPYRWVTRWIPLDKQDAQKHLKKIRKHWFAKRKSIAALTKDIVFQEGHSFEDRDALNKARDAETALEELGSDDVAYGYLTITCVITDQDKTAIEDKLIAVERILNAQGYGTIRENLNGIEAWLGSHPGNPYANIRKPIVSTMNLVHMMPISALWAGSETNTHLQGSPLIIAKTFGATPFRLSLHYGDVGHSLAVGPTGAGKSVLLSFLALQFRKYNGSQIIFFDKGQSAKAAVLAMEGSAFDLSLSGSLSLQPLSQIETDAERSWAFDWLKDLLLQEHISVTPDISKRLWTALTNLASAPQSQRTLTGLKLLLQHKDVRDALLPYTLGGPFGALLDADQDISMDVPVLHFEMQELLQHKKCTAPVLTYLFHKLERRFDGRPTLMILDEAWVFLDSPLFAERIRDWLKTLRKKNVSVLFATQSLSDIAQSTIAPALIESCPSRIFLPNSKALEPQMSEIYQRFGLNAKQVELISTAIPKQDYYLQSPMGNRMFELGLGPIALALCGASDAKTQKTIRKDQTHPKTFLPQFLEAKGLLETAHSLANQTSTQQAFN
ncbi:MAG: conjugal transfer protein TrbE, partial [Pseudomonadota bacterium]